MNNPIPPGGMRYAFPPYIWLSSWSLGTRVFFTRLLTFPR